jgi:hypothetical protein
MPIKLTSCESCGALWDDSYINNESRVCPICSGEETYYPTESKTIAQIISDDLKDIYSSKQISTSEDRSPAERLNDLQGFIQHIFGVNVWLEESESDSHGFTLISRIHPKEGGLMVARIQVLPSFDGPKLSYRGSSRSTNIKYNLSEKIGKEVTSNLEKGMKALYHYQTERIADNDNLN